jgi:hypothetical protein
MAEAGGLHFAEHHLRVILDRAKLAGKETGVCRNAVFIR